MPKRGARVATPGDVGNLVVRIFPIAVVGDVHDVTLLVERRYFPKFPGRVTFQDDVSDDRVVRVFATYVAQIANKGGF